MSDMPDARALLHANLHQVFSERDPDARRAAIERTYAEDVRFIDPDAEVVGRQALNDRAQELLDRAPADYVLEEDGPQYVGGDTAALAWRLGPPGSPPMGSTSSRWVMGSCSFCGLCSCLRRRRDTP